MNIIKTDEFLFVIREIINFPTIQIETKSPESYILFYRNQWLLSF